jgi:hypothetical protein
MELEKKNTAKKGVAYKVEQPPVSTVTVKAKEPENPVEDELLDEVDEIQDLDAETETDDDSDEGLDDSVDLEIEDEEEEKPVVKPEVPQKVVSKEAKKINALKNELRKRDEKLAEQAKQLEQRQEQEHEQALTKQYAEEGYSEAEAKKKAKDDVKLSSMERELELLKFERVNRAILSKYNVDDANLQKIMAAAKTGVMTVEQICRGIYGSEMSEKEKRALSSVSDDEKPQAKTANVSSATRTSAQPAKTSLSGKQLQAKQQLEKQWKRPISDKEFKAIWPE